MLRPRTISILFWFVVCLSSSHCAQREKGEEAITPEQPGMMASPTPTPTLTYATGWEDIAMVANYAKIKLDSAAHFTTTRNACGRDRYGVFDLDFWNSLANLTNAALHGATLSTPQCYPKPDRLPFMDGTAELTLAGGSKRMLFENKNYYEICTNIADANVARQLLTLLHRAVVVTDKDGCPNGWGSD